MKSSLFWDVRRRRLITTDVSGQFIGPIFRLWSSPKECVLGLFYNWKTGPISPETSVTNYQSSCVSQNREDLMPPCCPFLFDHRSMLRCASGGASLGYQTAANSRWFTWASSCLNRSAGRAECSAKDITAERARLDPASDSWDTWRSGKDGDRRGQRSLRHDDRS